MFSDSWLYTHRGHGFFKHSGGRHPCSYLPGMRLHGRLDICVGSHSHECMRIDQLYVISCAESQFVYSPALHGWRGKTVAKMRLMKYENKLCRENSFGSSEADGAWRLYCYDICGCCLVGGWWRRVTLCWPRLARLLKFSEWACI